MDTPAKTPADTSPGTGAVRGPQPPTTSGPQPPTTSGPPQPPTPAAGTPVYLPTVDLSSYLEALAALHGYDLDLNIYLDPVCGHEPQLVLDWVAAAARHAGLTFRRRMLAGPIEFLHEEPVHDADRVLLDDLEDHDRQLRIALGGTGRRYAAACQQLSRTEPDLIRPRQAHGPHLHGVTAGARIEVQLGADTAYATVTHVDQTQARLHVHLAGDRLHVFHASQVVRVVDEGEFLHHRGPPPAGPATAPAPQAEPPPPAGPPGQET